MPARTDLRGDRQTGYLGTRTRFAVATVAFLIAWIVALPAVAQTDCAECHEDEPSAEAFADSVHGFLECADCHSGAEDFPHQEGVGDVDCAMCHDDVTAAYAGSIHGQSRAHGEDEAPWCESCHGGIHTLAPSDDPGSSIHPMNLPETCGKCHSDPEMVAKFGIPVAKPIEAYYASAHFKGVEAGEHAATCSSCHGSHAIYAAGDPRSKVFHTNVPETCGECHAEITEAFEASVHGKAARHGVREAPVCTDCHGEHRILGPDMKESPVYTTNVPKMTCGRCHGDLRLADKYGIETPAFDSYSDSFHGLASRSGSLTVASCSSCHGVHDILPSSDPASHVHKDNLAETCGHCHPGAGEKYAIGTVHSVATDKAAFPLLYWVRWVYIWMIVLTIGGMLLHNGLDLFRKVRSPQPRRAVQTVPAKVRMLPGFRLAHVLMMISFGVLVYTGFGLKYPESWWAAPLLGLEEKFAFRGWIHRVAALLMILSLVVHMVHLIVNRTARRMISRMRPSWHDVTELREKLTWFLGKRKQMPRSPALGYPEKMEYIALMWGILVMTITGFALWFENPMLRLFPKWVTDLATVIHFYEAILATLAIVVWHFYFVIFDPMVYPMDTAWINGREVPGRAIERGHDEPLAEAVPAAPKVDETPKPQGGIQAHG